MLRYFTLLQVIAITFLNSGFSYSDTNLGIQLKNEADQLSQTGDFKKAIPLYEKAYSLLNRLDNNNLDAISTEGALAVAYQSTGQSAEAIIHYKNVKKSLQELYGNDSDFTIAAGLGLASALVEAGKFDEAQASLDNDKNLLKKALEGNDIALKSVMLLSICLNFNYEYVKSIDLFKKLNQVQNKSPDFEIQINEIGITAYMGLGQVNETLQLYNRNLEICKSNFKSSDTRTIHAFNGLVVFYTATGNFDKALELSNNSIDLVRKNYRTPPKEFLPSFVIHADILKNKEKYSEAEEILKYTLNISKQTYGEKNFFLGHVYRTLCSVYIKLKKFDLALESIQSAISIEKTISGTSSQLINRYQRILAEIKLQTHHYAEASEIATNILKQFEESLPPEHPDIYYTLRLLSKSLYLNGDIEISKEYSKKLFNSEFKQFEKILTLDEKTRLAWQDENSDNFFYAFLDSVDIAELNIKTKGVVLDSLSEDRALALAAANSIEGNTILNKIKSFQTKLSKISFEQGKELECSKLQDEIGRLQREITAKYLGNDRQRSSANITMADIMPALAGGGVLVDFIQFSDPKLNGDEAICLGAIITGQDNKPAFVRIDGGKPINRAIDSLRAAINQGNASEVEAQTQFLSEKLWSPIAAKIPEGTKRLFLCPDANLNFLSFAALLESDGRFVAEKYPISYIGSARDLAKKPSGKISKSMALVANPQFDAADKNAKTKDLVAMRSAEADVFGSIALPPLPGTEAEAAALQSLAVESGWKTKSYLGKDATETSVRTTKKPGVLHLATHGFYLNSFTPPGPEGSRGMSVVSAKETAEDIKKKEKGVDPMRASGVAFTGAQQTLTSWSQRKAPNPETDGILTAEEVGALRLDGTWLVTLSACETGVGEARSGEGVFGLRRAFMIAGAENLLMTLWPVADETTAKIMTDFYKEAFATGDAPGSLAKVQRDWLVKLRLERGLLAAVREAGPFAMVAMTNPNAQREFVEGQLEIAPEKAAIPKSAKILEFQVALANADAGDAYAQAVVSIYYGLGVGCDQDPAKSKDYVMLSAKQQNPLGIYRLAEMREVGEGMDQNIEQAQQLMKKAKPGLQKLSSDPYALTALATIYERENPESPKIREVLTKASEMGYEPAQEKLNQLPTNQ